jgi:hypothetical protein
MAERWKDPGQDSEDEESQRLNAGEPEPLQYSYSQDSLPKTHGEKPNIRAS